MTENAGTGLLAVWMGPPPELEEDLDRWYRQEHVPERMAVPGFLRVRRYEALQGEPKYIALYELESPEVLHSEAYLQRSRNPTPWTRRIVGGLQGSIRREYELIKAVGGPPAGGAPFVYLVALETEPEHDAELNDWYNTEHLDALAGVPGVFSARRYRSANSTPKYLAVYELAEAGIPASDVWRKAADTPWTLKMRPRFKNRASHLGRLIEAAG